jgi:hypothetical protein
MRVYLSLALAEGDPLVWMRHGCHAQMLSECLQKKEDWPSREPRGVMKVRMQEIAKTARDC